MLRPALAAALLLVCLSMALHAQARPESADSADVLVLDHDFSAGDELVRIFLADGQVYRAELSSTDATLQLSPRYSGRRIPRIYPISDPRSPSGSSVVEIYPDEDGEYEIRTISMQGSRLSTRLRIYRDIAGSRRRVAAAEKPGWDLGVEVGGGWHSGFVQTSVVPAIGSEPNGGTDLEACLSARSAPKTPRFGMCVLGVSNQAQSGAPSMLWVYTEPRLGVLRPDRNGYSSWEAGALFRFGVDIKSATPTARMFAPGVFLSRHIRNSRQGTSWSLQMSYSWAFFKGFKKPAFSTGDAFTPKSHRISFGVGWYR
ncbi:MAG TPA: hypothetical protein VNO19_10710 [Gemmatimonadales bacterium]|nr:hypothetical protein [Gemmatimonadales bacterium]